MSIYYIGEYITYTVYYPNHHNTNALRQSQSSPPPTHLRNNRLYTFAPLLPLDTPTYNPANSVILKTSSEHTVFIIEYCESIL